MANKILSKITSAAFGAALSVVGGVTSTQAASFMGLGDLAGGGFRSQALGVSGDGSVVVGYSAPDGNAREAFRWTESEGMVGIGFLPNRTFGSEAHGVSGDGSVIVGHARSSQFSPINEAFRWTEGEGMVGLGDLPGGDFFSQAVAASADGSVIVGRSRSSNIGTEAFLWTESGGMIGLGDLPGGFLNSSANDVSADGSVVVGQGEIRNNAGAGVNEAFRWTESEGMVGLGGFRTTAHGVSADGSVVIGGGVFGGFGGLGLAHFEAFRWTESGGIVRLGDLPGGDANNCTGLGCRSNSEAFGVSGDGSVVVGQGNSDNGFEAFIWDEINGMRSLQEVLSNDFGLDLTDWHLQRATGVSDDGRTIVGFGINPDGNEEAWIARLDLDNSASVPEPTSVIGMFAIAGLGISLKGKKQRS